MPCEYFKKFYIMQNPELYIKWKIMKFIIYLHDVYHQNVIKLIVMYILDKKAIWASKCVKSYLHDIIVVYECHLGVCD